MPTPITIRNANEADLPAILDIYNHVIVNTTAVYSDHPHTLKMRQNWYNDRINNNFPVFIADAKGEVAGFATFGHFRAWPCYRYTVELSVYVAIEHRGNGISKVLLQELIARAREMNIHVMIAGISADNSTSLALHQSFDFVEVANFKEVGYKFGRWLDLKFLQLVLPNVPEAI